MNSWDMHAKTRVLLVEDIEAQLKGLRKDIELIPEDQRNTFGVGVFEVDEASCTNDSIQKLAEAKANNRPYDLMVLDLSLPWNKGENDRPENGYEVLKIVKESRAAKGVIVLSVLSHYGYVVKAFHGGAIDFIEKESPLREKVQERVLRNLAAVFAEESNRILRDRIYELTPQVVNGFAHHFSAVFSTLVNSSARTIGEVRKYVRERYGLTPERDVQDVLIRQLRTHEESVNTARQEWAELRALLSESDESQRGEPKEKLLEKLLWETIERLQPCLTVKKMQLLLDFPQSDKLHVLSFGEDVQAVLKEIVLGGLSELPDYGDSQAISVTITANDMRAALRFEDDLTPLSEPDAGKINEAYSIAPDFKFGRVWGLSIAQQIALRGGGELVVEPQTNGNVITYRIPRANHA